MDGRFAVRRSQSRAHLRSLHTSRMGGKELIPQGLKPTILLAFFGTSKLVPFQNSPCAEIPLEFQCGFRFREFLEREF
jgi:hypothetical protein